MRNMKPGRLTIQHFLECEGGSEINGGAFIKAEASFECSGCGRHFKTEISSGGCSLDYFGTSMDFFLDTLRWGIPDSTSFQHGHILCEKCTSVVDAQVVPADEDRNATAPEVERGLRKCKP